MLVYIARLLLVVCVGTALMSFVLQALTRTGLPSSASLLLRQYLPASLLSTNAMATGAPAPPGTFCAAFVTVPNMEVAKTIATGLVTNKLAACVNVVPGVTSIYEWEGKIEEDSELILMIKSRCSLTEELTEFVKKNHPYDVCEVITTKIEGGNPAYLKWLGDTVKEKV